ncbi:MAG TPA: NBR1-Ig-like domain-containing protein [Anaerolineales bacterium]|nr:NBR1-Ig-like domain-containing protein [Anaerolineales bacterium]
MNIKMLIRLGLAFLLLTLAACNMRSQAQPTQTQTDPGAVMTAAAQTADARMTEMLAITATTAPSATPDSATATPSFTATSAATAQVIPPTATTAGGLPPSGGAPATGDRAEFVADVTVPDGEGFNPNESFTKTWRLQNVGTTTWTNAFSLVFVSGAPMGGTSVNLPQEVAPNGTVDISVNLTAPADPGNYRGYWSLQNADGQNFGVGPSSQESIGVDINVVGDGTAVPVNTPNPGATTSPGGSGGVISNVSLAVDNESATRVDCPYTFTFTARFTVDKASTVTYELEAGSSNADFDLQLPSPTTTQLQPGSYTFNYTLEFNASFSGWAQLHVTAPEDVSSNQVQFVLACGSE